MSLFFVFKYKNSVLFFDFQGGPKIFFLRAREWLCLPISADKASATMARCTLCSEASSQADGHPIALQLLKPQLVFLDRKQARISDFDITLSINSHEVVRILRLF